MPAGRARTHFLEMMGRGQTPYGIFVSSLDPAMTEIMGTAGFDFVLLDNEHGRLGRIEVENHARAATASGIIPLVRILENSPTLIQSMFDSGAQGVAVPHVDTAEDARRAVEASYYSPRGRRGMCPACYAGEYTMRNWSTYSKRADENVMVIPIIESRKSVENIESILAVDGIDVVHFGPGDLSADMGLDLNVDSRHLMDAWDHVRNATRRAGKWTLNVPNYGFDGADMVVDAMDYMIMAKIAASMVADHKARLAATVSAAA